MAASSIYIPMGARDSEPAPVGFFMMNHLLYSRMDCGYPSNDECYDEDVNVYLAGLLESLIYPAMHDEMKENVMPYDLTLFEAVNEKDDPRGKYLRYRINADFILVAQGIFNNPKGMRPNSAPHMGISRESWLGRGKAYYSMARSYCLQTYHRPTAISDIMGKLSENFEKYLKILSLMKSEYFNILDHISDGEMYHLERAVRHEDIRKELSVLHDEFLDAYSDHMRNRSEATRLTVEEKAARIHELDPSFSFALE